LPIVRRGLGNGFLRSVSVPRAAFCSGYGLESRRFGLFTIVDA
jgi:hypothetical protein